MPSPATWCWWLKGTGCSRSMPGSVPVAERTMPPSTHSTNATRNTAPKIVTRERVLALRWKICAIAAEADHIKNASRIKVAIFTAPRHACACCARCLRVAIVEPRLGGVGVAAALPESLAVVIEKLDAPDPLRALPRIQPRRNHAARSAVLARQRLPFPAMHEQHVVIDGARQREVGGVA